MRFLRKSLTGLFLLAVTIGIIFFAYDMVSTAFQERAAGNERRGSGARERVFAVNTVPFEIGVHTPVLQIFGEVQSQRSLDLRPSVGGTVIALHPALLNGGRVQKGDILMRLDPSNAQTALQLAQADLSDAQAEREEAQRALELAKEDVQAAQIQADLRKKAEKRQADLVALGVGTTANLETAELTTASANQAVLARKQALQSNEARLNQAFAKLERLKINLSETQRRLDDTTMHASFSGALSEVAVVEGGVISSNERIGKLIDPDSLQVAFRVSTVQHARLLDKNGRIMATQIQAALDILGAEIVTTGTLAREAAVVGEGQSGRQLFSTLDNPKGFRPGDFVQITITEPQIGGVAVLPAAAVSANNKVLTVDDDNRLTEADVQIIRRQGDDVLVRARGLNGANVVAQRSPLLGAGIKVSVIGAKSDATAAPTEIEISNERRAKLIAFIEGNKRMPAEAKARVLERLNQAKVPVEMLNRLESRMGGS